MTALIIFGASDDLIEIQGAVQDELYAEFDGPTLVTVRVDRLVHSQLVVEYDPDGTGEWRVRFQRLDGGSVEVIRARGEEHGDDEHGCPGYSDKAVIHFGPVDPARVSVEAVPAESGEAGR